MSKYKELYFLRHCKTKYNLEMKISGCEDIEIIDDGIILNDVSLLNNYIILSSPLRRCLQTIQLLENKLGKSSDIIINDNLKERDMGIMSGKYRPDVIALYPDYFNENGKFIVEKTPIGGEDFVTFFNRISPVSNFIKELLEEKSVVVCGHNQALKLLYITLKNNDIGGWYDINLHNGELIKVKI